MEVATVVVGKLVDLLFLQIGRQIGYVLRYKDNINKLNHQVEDIKGAKGRMEVRIAEARRKGEIIEDDVQSWINSVDSVTLEAETFMARDAEKKTTCFNISSRYKSSKEATRKTSSIRELGGKVNEFVTVAHVAPPLGIDANPSQNVDAYESQKSAIKRMLDDLADGEVNVVGVCGIGGVGKTTLVTELGKSVKAGKQFGEVVMAVVSQPINIKKIQDDIAVGLGMGQLPDNDVSRREQLWKRIKGKKILLILDDLWSKVPLDEVGIPVGGNDGCKIILTSRSKDVCEEMDAEEIIEVEPMPEDEAWSLFKTKAGEVVETDDEIKQIAKEITKECGRLPIAILAVGRALRNKKRKVEWEDACHQLKKAAPPTVNPMLREVFPKLKLSYDFLEDKDAKSCFLLCCMFPEDYDIPVELLAEYGIGLRLFRDSGESLQEARLGARSAVSTLKGSCLLLDGEDNDHVKMHDVVRDVAIVIASEDERNTFLVKTGLRLKEWPKGDTFDKYVGISLVQNDIATLPVELKLPKLQILLVQRNRGLSEIPYEFFQGMKDIKVLDLHECGISSLPRSLSLLITLRSLHLEGSKFKEMSVLEGLKKLEILDLSSTNITEIPEQIGGLTNLMLLDMRGCKLSHIAAGIISSLHILEELYVGDSFIRWDANDGQEESNQIRKNASLKELESLSKLRVLDIVVPDIKALPQNLQLKSLHRFMITIGCKDWHDSIRIEHPDCSILDLTDMNIPVLSWIKKLTDAAEYLILNSIKNLRNVVKDLNGVTFNKNRFLEISDCDDVSCLADTVSKSAFCNLEILRVKNLKNFTEICHGGQLLSTGGSFRKLRKISIDGCSNMSTALGFNMLILLQNLTKLEVSDCNSMEYILGSMRPEIYKPGDENLIVFRLKKIFILACKSLEHIFEPELVGTAHSRALHSSCFQYLELVKLVLCGNLRYIFSPSIAEGLSQLRKLEVVSCKKLEAIIIGGGFPESEGRNENVTEESSSSSSTSRTEPKPEKKKKIIVFPSLSSIELVCLEALKSFCSEPNYTSMEYPSLDYLRIIGCPELESWGFGIQVAHNLKLEEIGVYICGGFELTKSKSDDGELIVMLHKVKSPYL